jgi:hypothetical protein
VVARRSRPRPSKSTPYRRWLDTHAQRPPIFYHYTTAQGLVGILESGSLWATNSRFLNDPTEIEYAIRLFRHAGLHEIDARPAPRSFHAEALKGWITNSLNYYQEEAKVYVSCFCENGDLLSQWRGYGASGGGYAIGFAAEHIPQLDVRLTHPPEFIMRRVIYEPAEQEALIREHVGAECESPRGGEDFALFFSESLNCFKDAAYRDEREWRAIQFGRAGGKDIRTSHFRVVNGRIIDYTKVDFRATEGKYEGKLPICTVWYGPTLDPKRTERSLKILLGAHGYDGSLVEIKPSAVPFTA